MARMKRIRSRISLLRYSQSTDVSGAALNHAMEKTVIPALKKIILRMMPKTTKTPLIQLMNKMDGKMGRLALVNRPRTKIRRTVITFRPLRMRWASAPRISSCLRNLVSRSALSAN